MAREIDPTDANIVNAIIEAQDYALQLQKERAENSRRRVESGWGKPLFHRWFS